jgi:hypothetical protein
MTEAEQKNLEQTLVQTVGPMPDNTSATAYPYWLIIDPVQMMRPDAGTVSSMITGPFLSREDAEEHLQARPHAFSDRAVVWCHSGHASRRWRALCDVRNQLREVQPEPAPAPHSPHRAG